MRKIIVMIYMVLDVALLMLLAIIIYKLNLSTKEAESSILNKSVDNNSLSCTVNKKTKSPYSDELLNTCIVYENGNVFLYYGENERGVQGKIVYQADNVDIVVIIFKTFYAIETKGADFFFKCTTDLQFDPYDSHYYVFWVSGDNNSFYGRINRVIDMNMLKNKVEKFNVYVEKGE